jgi:hypothetical protein
MGMRFSPSGSWTRGTGNGNAVLTFRFMDERDREEEPGLPREIPIVCAPAGGRKMDRDMNGSRTLHR